jgi:predicted O-methyltransferase YrrM
VSKFTDRARGYWKEGGSRAKSIFDLALVGALDKMIAAGEGPFDLAFL